MTHIATVESVGDELEWRRPRLRVIAVISISVLTALLGLPLPVAIAGKADIAPIYQAAAPTQPGVYLYEHRDHAGRFIRLEGSEWNLVALGFNDITSSVYVVGDYRVTLYEHVNFTGARSTIRGGKCDWIAGPHKASLYDIWQPPGCYTEFPSPAEIGNDQVSSVAITGPGSYFLSTRLAWPFGMWINATPHSSIGWHFYPSPTYTFSYHDSSGLVQVSGSYQLMNISVGWLGYSPVVRTYNNRVYRNGSYVGPDPDHSYQYLYKNGGNTISVLSGSWQDYYFSPM